MKLINVKLLVIAIVFAFTNISIAQTVAWEEDFTIEPFAQAAGGKTVLLDITNQGKDAQECIVKARQQAIFSVIFKGYDKSQSAPASAPLTDLSIYSQKLEFFKDYLTSNTAGLGFVSKAKTNMKKPPSKISRKVIKHTTTVTINKTQLRENLEKLGILKSIADLGFQPEILIVPGDGWMKKLGAVKTVDNQGYEQKVYEYGKAITNPQFNMIAKFVGAKFDNAFKIADFRSKLETINSEVQKNNARNDGFNESEMDIYARVVAADLWIKIDLVSETVSGGMETQYQITMTALDPLVNRTVINGLPQTIKTSGDNKMQLIENTINAVSDEFRPRVLDYFAKREEVGLEGKIEFAISEELDVTFDTDIDVDGEDYSFSEVIDAMVDKISVKFATSGSQTKTRRVYDVTIPTKVENKLSGKIGTNNFEKFGRKINKAVKPFGYKAVLESQGLGKVLIIFTEEL